MICAGIDAGSRTTKVVLVDGAGQDVIASGVVDQGVQQDVIASELLDSLLREHGLTRESVHRTVATGYGRNGISAADLTITEITCQAVGVRRVAPACATIIDIGGQDSKLIRLAPDGGVEDFAMNDRCAAGTGRFLEVVAARLGVTLDKLVELAARSTNPASISSMCVVFAESEIVGLLADGAKPEDIVAGVEASIARRVAAMAGRRTKGPVVFTGGVALVGAMRASLEGVLGLDVAIAPDPQLTGALGAALLAAREPRRKQGA